VNATLRITDGTAYVDLIRGAYHLNDWTPLVTQAKGGGRFSDSPLSDGRQLRSMQWDNVTESFTLQLNAACQDSAIEFTQTLRRLLVKAKDYWTTDWQDTPVYIECRAPDETNTRYALIMMGSLENDTNYFNQPFTAVDWVGNVVMDELPLTLERKHWLGNVPGTGTAQLQSATTEWLWDQAFKQEAGPVGIFVYPIIVSTGGWLIVGDTSSVWRTNTGLAGSWLQHTFGAGDWDFDPGEVNAFCEDAAADVYAGCANGIFRSVDNGDNWVRRIAARTGTTFHCIMYATDGNYYLADFLANGLYSSADGAIWNLEYTQPSIRCVFEDSTGLLLAGVSGNVAKEELRLLYDDGSGWQFLSIYSGEVNAAIYGFYEAGGYVYAMTTIGLLKAPIGTVDFMETGAGLRNITDIVKVNNFYYAVANDKMYYSHDLTGWTITYDNAVNMRALAYFPVSDYMYYTGAGEIGFRDANVVDMGREDTTEEIYIVNHDIDQKQINWIKEDDAGGFTDLFPMTGAFPVNLLPANPQQNDAIYFGLEVNDILVTFYSLVFDIATPYYDSIVPALTWQYYSVAPAWVDLDVQDNTDMFRNLGVNSVHWKVPSNIKTTGVAIDGKTLIWIRCLVDYAATVNATPPTQQNREIYTVSRNPISIAAADVPGDIEAFIIVRMTNRSDLNGITDGDPNLYSDRVVMGLRSLSRGTEFSAFISFAEYFSPIGIKIESRGVSLCA